MTGQRVAYIRVSSVDQNTARQLDGVPRDKTFTEKASGKSAERPQLKDLIAYVREGDTVVVHSMDRLARNVEDLRRVVRELTDKKVRVEFVKEQLTFTGEENAAATLMLNLIGAVAEFERSLIRERQREGIAVAKKAGVYNRGRKKKLDEKAVELLRARIAAGESKAKVAREAEISRETLYKYLRASEEPVSA